MVDFNSIEQKFKKALEDLPGEYSHKKMSARPSKKIVNSFKKKGETRIGGVLVCLYPKDNEWYFPLIQRPSYDGAHSRQVSFPGGKQDPEDSSVIHTALREAREEINIQEENVQILGELSQLHIPVSGYLVTPVVGYLRRRPEFVPEVREVDEIIEIRLSDFLDKSNQKEKILNIRGYEIMAPYFALNDKVVWGATAMMLSEFYDLIIERDIFQ